VSARKATLHALAEVGQDIIQLDEDLKTKQAWTAAASITGNHYCEKDSTVKPVVWFWSKGGRV
jgi:hypothetical protein